MLFKGFPNECDVLTSLRNGVLERGCSRRWGTGWEENAKPLISEVIFPFPFGTTQYRSFFVDDILF